MADEESFEAGQEEGSSAPPQVEEVVRPARQHGDDNEARKAMEDAKKQRIEKQQQEMEEYEEMRREAREKEAQEIQELRERRERRKAEREAEEVRLTELRAQEEARRKAEEEVRKRKKAEEEIRIKEEKERKKREAEERLKKSKKPNFVITKRSDSEKGSGGPERGVLEPLNADDMQKSKEQLEEEKRAILAQRINPLSIEGFTSDKLLGRAKELVETIRRLEGDKYDLEQRFKRQQYDMIELAERARQMNKGKGKRGVSSVQVDESFDRLADKFTSAPVSIPHYNDAVVSPGIPGQTRYPVPDVCITVGIPGQTWPLVPYACHTVEIRNRLGTQYPMFVSL
ncbi:troponin T, skeletal muscle-like isoform X10 [Haliotis rufescens]|uniref:troponin T, skeletal muscle-like isoform X10 n=1 Tax=Haliotis rufescens TaxID=6454 RepID=UPI00201FA8BD|nr:troponin T, skeletal muscle-like isoform X10 [Haliotis rufescens]XP_048241578.1 troponin T, skeletal muscle-like isoform X10 [Haliotis rufescens]XP_048241579.1 troponin T, skeletal muscle-like isoform X11 [Haliotis rufescens]XP_048241580.1 troponin T, skeletal muscle-like isoform X10 [Haliotis rufescens]